MFDMGGQRDQRAKWMQVFVGIQAVLFVISCSDYDQTLREDPTKNRLEEAIALFSGVWHNRFLSESGVIVFLNKQDIMEQKVYRGKSIGKYFADYKNFQLPTKYGIDIDECTKTKHFIRSKLVVSRARLIIVRFYLKKALFFRI